MHHGRESGSLSVRYTPADEEHPQDRLGCALLALRTGCGMSLLWVIMFITMILVGLLSLIFFR